MTAILCLLAASWTYLSLHKQADTFGRCSSRILLLTMLCPIIPLKTAVCGRTERIRLERDSTNGC